MFDFRHDFDLEKMSITVLSTGAEYDGYFANCRIPSAAMDKGWHKYDLRRGDANNGKAVEIKNGTIRTNYFGTFCCPDKLPLRKGESLRREGGENNEFEYHYWSRSCDLF